MALTVSRFQRVWILILAQTSCKDVDLLGRNKHIAPLNNIFMFDYAQRHFLLQTVYVSSRVKGLVGSDPMGSRCYMMRVSPVTQSPSDSVRKYRYLSIKTIQVSEKSTKIPCTLTIYVSKCAWEHALLLTGIHIISYGIMLLGGSELHAPSLSW